MSSEPKRKLAAIMFTDIVGYTALMGKDERRARELLEKQREALYPVVEKHEGRVLKEIGDGTLSMFGSAIKAVDCAIVLQKMLKNVEGLKLRIGIHVGDVVIEHDDVFGDGVNVASRIESLAEPGGICVSGRVHDDIRNQPQMTAVSLGRKKLKNVQRPVEVFALSGEGLPSPGVHKRFFQSRKFNSGLGIAASIIVIAIVYFLAIRGGKVLYGDVPSVGVLYLENLGAEEDEFFSYGITEDLIIDLSKLGVIRVPPMKDILSHKETKQSLSEIAASLRVKYILTGSFRKEADNFRLAVQLVEPVDGNTLWSERWEEPLTEVSSIKGRMIGEVISALGLSKRSETAMEIQKKSTTDPGAYEYYLRGKYRYDHRESVEDAEVARGLLESSIKSDPVFLSSRMKLGDSYFDVADYDRALEIYSEALTVAESEGNINGRASVLMVFGRVHWKRSEYDEALTQFTLSLLAFEQTNNLSGKGEVFNNIGIIFEEQGELDKAIEQYSQALEIHLQLDDRYREGVVLSNIGNIYLGRGDYQESLEYYNQAVTIFKELGNLFTVELIESNIGVVYDKLGEHEKSLEFHNRSILTAGKLGDREGESIGLNNIGMIYLESGEYDKAKDHYTRSLVIAEEIGYVYGKIRGIANLGIVNQLLGKHKEALKQLESALLLAREIGDRPGEKEILGNIANIYIELSEYDKGLDYSYRRLAIAEETGDKAEQGYSHWSIGVIYYQKDELETSIKHLRVAVETLDTLGIKSSQRLLPSVLIRLVEVKLMPKDSAFSITQDLENLFEEAEEIDLGSSVLWIASQVYNEVENTDKARIYLERAYSDLMRRAYKIESEENRLSFLTEVKDNKDIISAWERLSGPE